MTCFRVFVFAVRECPLMPSRMVPKLDKLLGTSPCLVMSGDKDQIIPAAAIENEIDQLRKKNCQIEYHALKGQHCMMMPTNPNLYTKLITEFLDANK